MIRIKTMLDKFIKKFRDKINLAPPDADDLFDAIVTETDEAVLAGLLKSWNSKGITEGEIFAMAQIMRSRMTRLGSVHSDPIDIVGTGGSKSAKTFNVSTAAAFVVAGAGVPVAKHGNRAATSRSGSADVLSELGVKVDADHGTIEQCLDELGLCFMFAPRFHTLSPVLAKARASLGEPTIFNVLGPLSNPAAVRRQVVGVWDRSLLHLTASVLLRFGSTRAWVVHGHDGLDEISLAGKTMVCEVNSGEIRQFEVCASDFGVEPKGDGLPSCFSANESATLIRGILDNERLGGDAECLVVMNAAAAICVSGAAETLLESGEMAIQSVRSGSAREKLEDLIGMTNQ